MSIINRHGPCIGFKLFKFGQHQLELWICPPWYSIEPHSHPQEHIELTFLFGSATFWRKNEEGERTVKMQWPFNMFETFSVRAGNEHSFTTNGWPLVFLNRERWLDGVTPTSASVDFVR